MRESAPAGGEQPGEGLLLPGAVDEPLQPEAAVEERKGLRRTEEEGLLHESLLKSGRGSKGSTLTGGRGAAPGRAVPAF